ncbi:MAG: hypothetical protein WCM76_08755 [Bacteroidota bacterium]
MKKISLILGVLFVLFAAKNMNAQNCVSWYPTETSSRWETTSYDSKDNVTGITVSKVMSKEITPKGMVMIIEGESYDAKHTSQGKNSFTVGCADGKFFVSLDNLVNKSMYKDMDVNVTSDNLELPYAPTTGMTLPDGQITMSVSNKGVPIINMTISITNRKVESVENITTSAGTFECYKITYDVTTKSFINVTTKSIEWYCKETGVVRSETHDSNGKLMGYSLLTKFTK